MDRSCLQRQLLFSKVQVFAILALAALAGTSFSKASWAQGNQADKQLEIPKLSYDVVSIRPSDADPATGVRLSMNAPADRAVLDSINNTVENLVGVAYGERHYEISGAPDWAHSKYWVIHAKGDEAATETLKKLDPDQAKAAKKQMLQQLLKDRFHLEVHSITKETQAYDLVVSKKGPKFQNSQAITPNYWMRCGSNGCEWNAAQVSMKRLADGLTGGAVSTEVSDKTGLNGIYDFKLTFRPSYSTGLSEDIPLIFTALEEQLGLRLVPAKGLKQVIVIDHIEMPTEN